MFSWFKNEKTTKEELLKEKINEIRNDYKDYPTKATLLNDEDAKELAEIRIDVEKKFGKYRNEYTIEMIKRDALTCYDYRFIGFKYPETIFKEGSCSKYNQYYPDFTTTTLQECEDAEREIKRIMEGYYRK